MPRVEVGKAVEVPHHRTLRHKTYSARAVVQTHNGPRVTSVETRVVRLIPGGAERAQARLEGVRKKTGAWINEH